MIGFAAGGKGDDFQDGTGWISGNQTGGGANYLCLPQDPHLNHSTPGQHDTRSRIFQAEYRSFDDGPLKSKHGHDSPCATCQTRGGRTQVLMIPAITNCPGGWNKEYDGYLVAARWNNPRTEYVCMDRSPESIPGGNANTLISFFFQVEIVVSPETTLPPAYVTGSELTCVVCTM